MEWKGRLSELREGKTNKEFIEAMELILNKRNVYTKNFGWVRKDDFDSHLFLQKDAGIPCNEQEKEDRHGKYRYCQPTIAFLSWRQNRWKDIHRHYEEMSFQALIDEYPEGTEHKSLLL